MDVRILSTERVKPSSPTPDHLRNYKPSFLDQMPAPFYIPLTVFYQRGFDPETLPTTHARLKRSLARTLARFYPLAGRIESISNVVCSDDGVLYVAAETGGGLSQFLESPNLKLLKKLLPMEGNSLEKEEEGGCQVAVQVTVFSCGGFAIGACFFHRIADATTMANVLKTWAGLCASTSDSETKNHDSVDLELGSTLFPPLPSVPADYLANRTRFYFSDGPDPIATRRFVFSHSAIAALREKAASAAVPNPSRVETLTGFVSERLIAGMKESALVTHAVNIRRRIEPPVPEIAFGNFIWYAAAVYASPEEGEALGLPDYVEAMREALDAVGGEELRSVVPESAVRVLSENMGMVVEAGIKVYMFSSWCNMGFYDLDFGWGRPIWVAHMGEGSPNWAKRQMTFLEGRNRGEIELWLLMGEDVIKILENDEEFLAFATPNPSILVKK